MFLLVASHMHSQTTWSNYANEDRKWRLKSRATQLKPWVESCVQVMISLVCLSHHHNVLVRIQSRYQVLYLFSYTDTSSASFSMYCREFCCRVRLGDIVPNAQQRKPKSTREGLQKLNKVQNQCRYFGYAYAIRNYFMNLQILHLFTILFRIEVKFCILKCLSVLTCSTRFVKVFQGSFFCQQSRATTRMHKQCSINSHKKLDAPEVQ